MPKKAVSMCLRFIDRAVEHVEVDLHAIVASTSTQQTLAAAGCTN